ncbi:MAG: HD domain-containing protein, partial [Anaerolineae bacterium]|nr:HD domain-containing protein [Anaerolineae bacterium]
MMTVAGKPICVSQEALQHSNTRSLPGDDIADLDQLLRQTYALWDPGWVTFTWRAYTYDHVQRVRGLALNLCEHEAGDPLAIELASLLHDITKPYDGEIIVDSHGKRIVDNEGFWRNHLRFPSRRNKVTELYDSLDLRGTLHNVSSAMIAQHLLAEYDLSTDTCARISQVIRDHLHPPDEAPIESLCLFDADTIDANIGMPSFVRNIYIHLHLHDVRREPGAPTIAEILRTDPMNYLRPYIADRLPAWVAGKQRDFIPRLRTQTGRALALERLTRLERLFEQLAQELAGPEETGKQGCLA